MIITKEETQQMLANYFWREYYFLSEEAQDFRMIFATDHEEGEKNDEFKRAY